MVTARDNTATPESGLWICGNGRIGGALRARLEEEQIAYVSARLDENLGLADESGKYAKTVDLLVICISARHRGTAYEGGWQWGEIYDGLAKQVARGELLVKSVIMVSSTRVYEGYDSGIVTASSEPRTQSIQGSALTEAERKLTGLANQCLILRCSGLYGALYPKYTPTLRSGKGKPRFGIDADVVVDRLWRAVAGGERREFRVQVELLTDGYAYFEGRKILVDERCLTTTEMAEKFRILKDSVCSLDG